MMSTKNKLVGPQSDYVTQKHGLSALQSWIFKQENPSVVYHGLRGLLEYISRQTFRVMLADGQRDAMNDFKQKQF